MCHESVLAFGAQNLSIEEIQDRYVIELGSRDVNGSLRSFIQSCRPASYIGIDVSSGPGVDVVCDVSEALDRFGTGVFDVVVATELLEHVLHWQEAVDAIKHLVKAEGLMLVTTRSPGFLYHGPPKNPFPDYWRFTMDDMRCIFSDCQILVLQNDWQVSGVFLKAKKPLNFKPIGLLKYTVAKQPEGWKDAKIVG